MRHRIVVATAVLLALTSSCGTTKIYGYQRTRKLEFPDVFEPSRLTNEARAALAAAKKVAFYPPDQCDPEATARPSDTAIDSRVMRMNCGVLLASLERSAESAGYNVVSWQTLRGSSRPIEYARASGIDVLFEINEFDLVTLKARDARTNLTFFKETDGEDHEPLTVEASVGKRCLQYARNGEDDTALGLSGTIDIKMVSVAGGANLWHYRRTEGVDFKVPDPPVRFRAAPKGRALGWAGLAVGTGMLIGAIRACQPYCSDDGATAAALIGVAGGVLILVSGNRIVRGPVEPPADVLCTRSPIREAASAQAHDSDAASSSFTYNESSDTRDAPDEERKRVQAVIVKDFLDTLADVRRFAPPAAAPPASPAPVEGAPPTTPASMPNAIDQNAPSPSRVPDHH